MTELRDGITSLHGIHVGKILNRSINTYKKRHLFRWDHKHVFNRKVIAYMELVFIYKMDSFIVFNLRMHKHLSIFDVLFQTFIQWIFKILETNKLTLKHNTKKIYLYSFRLKISNFLHWRLLRYAENKSAAIFQDGHQCCQFATKHSLLSFFYLFYHIIPGLFTSNCVFPKRCLTEWRNLPSKYVCYRRYPICS